jgi:hypothetical protein
MTNPVFFDAACRFGSANHEIQRRCPFAIARKVRSHCDNIPNVVSKIDHDVRSRRRKLVLSPHCLWLPLG